MIKKNFRTIDGVTVGDHLLSVTLVHPSFLRVFNENKCFIVLFKLNYFCIYYLID